MKTTYSLPVYQIALTYLPKVGPVKGKELAFLYPDLSDIFRLASYQAFASQALMEAEKTVQICLEDQVQILYFEDTAYPQRIKYLYDAPLILFKKGEADLNAHRMVAVVGTRHASDVGKKVTDELVQAAIKDQVILVSGFARGIDITLHKACLTYGVPTIAVLAGGFRHLYPFENSIYVEQILVDGALLSEYAPHIPPASYNFPIRNRIIAGLSDATVIVEAAEKGGALITADYAANYHRTVFAVPGSLNRPFSKGCNLLIRNNKATIYTSWEDLMQELNWEQAKDRLALNPGLSQKLFTLNESAVISLLHREGQLSFNELVQRGEIQQDELALILLNLELTGMIQSTDGDGYMLA
ncbi:DNA-processing protein DprA [Aquirufa sp. HETE-83D]|uniref:DNA-processing protein DprA n=1 Tax=Aquirufa esocilacus TaxID=3096513 RepID=A0ABW6DK81_9BACT